MATRSDRPAIDLSRLAEQSLDPSQPIEIAEDVWWVGHFLPDDPFQSHVYLIKAGRNSALIDPGSAITFPHTLHKIEKVLPFDDVRYFVCHHQDPDITSALPLIDQIVVRDDARIVTHWRAKTLLRHYGLRLPFWQVEDHDWRLPVDRHILRFVFTPYLHFPGAFCTFDEASGILFSSDLFGGFTKGFSLIARDEGYFEAMRPFHEHYMPSREILAHGLTKLEALPLRAIAPQHGSIIPQPLAGTLLRRLKALECGLYLLVQHNTDIRRLVKLNEVLRGITETMVLSRDFGTTANALLSLARKMLPVTSIEFFAENRSPDGTKHTLQLTPANGFRGAVATPPACLSDTLGCDRATWTDRVGSAFRLESAWPLPGPGDLGPNHVAALVPLFSPDRQVATAVAVMHLNIDDDLDTDAAAQVIQQMAVPLQVAVERESIYRMLDLEKQAIYERSIRDPLTGLFTRIYMQDTVTRMIDLHDRDHTTGFGLAMIDIDHFKRINDTYGHAQGDEVLRQVGDALIGTIRRSDLPVRFGGEEFAVFCPGRDAEHLAAMANRLRRRVAGLALSEPMHEETITISVGIVMRSRKEELEALIERADHALYTAKETGRNRVTFEAAETPAGVS